MAHQRNVAGKKTHRTRWRRPQRLQDSMSAGGFLEGPRRNGAREGLFVLHVHGQPGRGLFAAHARAADGIPGLPMSLDLVRQPDPGPRGNPH